MSMEVRDNYKDYKNEYLERAQMGEDKVKGMSKENNMDSKSKGIPIPKDEYIKSERTGNKPNGLYRMEQGEKCTVNTDKVDREIQKLKEEKKQILQQIKAANGDEKKIREWEKKLTQIEAEIKQKDNDTYRRQNAAYRIRLICPK